MTVREAGECDSDCGTGDTKTGELQKTRMNGGRVRRVGFTQSHPQK